MSRCCTTYMSHQRFPNAQGMGGVDKERGACRPKKNAPVVFNKMDN